MFITGKVQGVFFRQATKVVAKQHNLSGWVKNLDDGRVEAVIEGSEEDTDTMIRWARRGPANSRVKDLEIRQEQFTGSFADFEVLY